jgi:lysophospholipase-2
MLTSVSQVNSLIEAETATIPSDRVVVGGFSQGCVVATLTALRSKRRLGGVISLSGWLPLSHKIEEVCAVSGRL